MLKIFSYRLFQKGRILPGFRIVVNTLIPDNALFDESTGDFLIDETSGDYLTES